MIKFVVFIFAEPHPNFRHISARIVIELYLALTVRACLNVVEVFGFFWQVSARSEKMLNPIKYLYFCKLPILRNKYVFNTAVCVFASGISPFRTM